MLRRVAALLVLLAIAAASVILIYPRVKGNALSEYSFQPEPWMEVLPTEARELTVLFLGEWESQPELVEHLKGPETRLLGVRRATISSGDVEVLVLPNGGCIAKCSEAIPVRAVVYYLKNESRQRVYKALAVSGTLRYRFSGYTVFFAVGKTPAGEKDKNVASLLAFRESVMVVVWGPPKDAKDALESLISTSQGERLFDDELIRRAYFLARLDSTPLKLVVRKPPEGLQGMYLVMAVVIDGSGDVKLRAVLASEGASIDPKVLECRVLNMSSLQGIELSTDSTYSKDGLSMVEFTATREELELLVSRL